jgi:shikimate kinase
MWTILIGFNASGKTTLAHEMHRLSGRSMVDLDEAVCRLASRGLPEIFEEGGPALFRDFEERVLKALPSGESLVLATGGGTLERSVTRDLLRARGLLVWLDASWPDLRRRLEPAAPARPSPVWRHLGEEGLARLYRRRRPLYAAVSRLRLDATADPAILGRRLLGRCLQLEQAGPRDAP